MRYTVRESIVYVVGHIWTPGDVLCAQEINLDFYGLNNAADKDGNYTRESIEHWLDCHTGDFREIVDFCASLEVGDDTIEIPWATENGELAYMEATCEEVT